MRRTLRHAGEVLLAVATVVVPRSAPAEPLAPRPGNSQPQEQRVFTEVNAVLSDTQTHLEEMKVELALLSDITTFPCYISGRVEAGNLELHGSVPEESVRQRALELARRSTFLKVTDALQVQMNLSTRPAPRHARVLQQEAAELLHKTIGEQANRMSLGVRTNGAIVLKGTIDSLETKLEVSRLFRRLPGCFAVVNELTIQRVARDGQHVVQVTRDGSQVVLPSALEIETEPLAQAPRNVPPPIPQAPTVPPLPRPTQVSASTAPSSGSATRTDDLRWSSAVPASRTPERMASVPTTPDDSRSPVKWGTPSTALETQVKKLEPVNVPPPAPTPPQPVASPWTSPASRPAETIWTRGGVVKPELTVTTKIPPPTQVEARVVSTPLPITRPSGSSEEAEPKAPPPPSTEYAPINAAARSTSPQPTVVASSSRRWPPAYESSRPPNNGSPGVIVFDDEPPASTKRTEGTTAKAPTVAPAQLQRQVKSVCGRQARDVTVETQPDGVIQVKVKVPNLSAEDNLSRKILAIPEMTAPQVRLVMDVSP